MAMLEALPLKSTSPEAVRRTPLYLESQGQPLFAWLHRAERIELLRHGIVICPPIGHEQVHAHRALRHLADALARQGFLTLRLDYHGTGDSAGTDEEPDRVATWSANIRDASTWLRSQHSCEQISLVGLRLGAALAVAAARIHEVNSLVLWAPVTKGRAYVREMKALGMIASTPLLPFPEAPDDLQPAGFILTRQTCDDLQKIDVLKFPPRCERVLIVARDDVPEETQLLDHWRALPLDAEQIRAPGYADMMAEPHETKVPEGAIASIARWLTSPRKQAPSHATLRAASGSEALFSETTEARFSPEPGQEIRESLFSINEDPHLFGILCEGREGTNERPLVMLLNAGSAYRVGPGRLNVLLARRLALQGFPSLRMDLNGLGDSITADSGRENDPYAGTMFRDIDLALARLQARLGIKRAILVGLCSGAYAAFQSAAQLPNPILIESVLINPLTFYWKDGMSIQSAADNEITAFHYYRGAALQPSKWLKLLLGKSRIGVVGAVKMVLERRRLRSASAMQTVDAGGESTRVSHPRENNLSHDLHAAVEKGRTIACFFSRSDPGYSILTFHAAKEVRQLCAAGKLRISFISDTDHTFSDRVARGVVMQQICKHLCDRHSNGARTEPVR